MNHSIKLHYTDLETITIPASQINGFNYQIEKGQIDQYHLVLNRSSILTNIKGYPYPIDHNNLATYLTADHPAIVSLQIDDQDPLSIRWQQLPNPSLQDCQCEPINIRSYSILEEKQIILGNHKYLKDFFSNKIYQSK